MPSKPLETEIETKSVALANYRGWENAKLDKIKRNWPDQAFFGPNESVFIVEFKRPNEKPRPGQLATHRKLKKVGHPVYVIDNFDDFVVLLDRMCSKHGGGG